VAVTALEAALSSRTRAVVLPHTLGNPFNVDAVLAFCRRHDLFLVEDNCDALGSEYRGQRTGSFGHVGASSFFPAHHMTMGEGGAVYTNDERIHRAVLSLRDWGRDCLCAPGQDNACGRRFNQQHGALPRGYDHKYVYSHIGYSLRPLDLQAAIGLVQLEKLPEFTRRRRAIHDRLRQAAARVSWLRLQEP
jgi:CDP-6-deoxy-D-xylo-4-hexulose-3-dehydrase